MTAPAVTKGVLLDIDGTLLDSNDAHAMSWVDALEEHGLHGLAVTFESVRPLIGMGGDKLLAKIAKIDHESKEGEAISKRRRAIFETRYLPQLVPFEGVRTLLERVRAEGLRRVVATSASREELEGLLRQAGVIDLIDDEATASDAERSKPDPDIIHAAIARAELPPRELVMLGDTPYDVDAARKAGVRVIAFRTGGWKDADLEGAAAIYDGPSELLAEFDRSILHTA